MSKVLKSYYIGDPDPEYERGQDKYGYVHCLEWVMIYPKTGGVYKVAWNGCGIGEAATLEEAKEKLHAYALAQLEQALSKKMNEVLRLHNAVNTMQKEGVKALDRYEGPYDDRGI